MRVSMGLASAALVLLAACSGDGGGATDTSGGADTAVGEVSPLDTGAPDLGAPDVPVVIDVPVDVSVDTGYDGCPADCPEGFCENRRCLYCGDNDDCMLGEWCREERCVRTACVPGTLACADWDVTTCAEDGLSWGAPEPCPGEERCTSGECLPVICEPGDASCEDLQVRECNTAGTGWLSYPCAPGSICEGDEGCQPYKNNIVLIFDTSGSMDAAPFDIGTECVVECAGGGCPTLPYPACESPMCPRSRLGLSKLAFMRLFSLITTPNINLIVTRFPQRVSKSQGDCGDMFGTGHYQPGMTDSSYITGDDDDHEPPDGSWFDQYLHEIISVPMPKTTDDDTFAQARLWMDFDEVVEPFHEEPCVSDDDCVNGYCELDEGERVCWRHTNPELRATGNTPLGRSLFYAGEVIRKYVKPDGKSCESDADCDNVNYYCGPDGTCFDPLGHCRSLSIILFTDGVEDPATSTAEFHNPRVQAKRMRYGLSCATDADCGEGASCLSGICNGYPRPNGSGGSGPQPSDPDPSRLVTYEGQPLEVITHVIDMGSGDGTTANRLIADEGGGKYFSVRSDNPDEFVQALQNITDIKHTLSCVPQFPAGWGDRVGRVRGTRLRGPRNTAFVLRSEEPVHVLVHVLVHACPPPAVLHGRNEGVENHGRRRTGRPRSQRRRARCPRSDEAAFGGATAPSAARSAGRRPRSRRG